MEIVMLRTPDIQEIISLAHITWQHTYRQIISQEQIDFMLGKFYSHSVLEEQMKDPSHFFFGVKENEHLLGYSHSFLYNDGLKLSKLYVNPTKQSKGCGKALLHHLEQFAKEAKIPTIKLNVNRNNPAKDFYLMMGFKIVKEVDIPLDKFCLNDYIMVKQLSIEA